MNVGVVSVQGAFPEHVSAVDAALRHLGKKGRAVTVRRLADLEGVEALILPGGRARRSPSFWSALGCRRAFRRWPGRACR